MFQRFDPDPIQGIKWVTAFLILLGAVETRVHWEAFAAGDDPRLVVLWFVVACVGATFGVGFVFRLAKRRGRGAGARARITSPGGDVDA